MIVEVKALSVSHSLVIPLIVFVYRLNHVLGHVPLAARRGGDA